ncbi:unnamed protein product [marine sediment metagenome]|uniref:Rho termination factor N-terminal domain-containing protein n=1 Tax=marine sediment metagenome TaxID=412755 RepID=X1HSU5_9ZZZZ
MLYKIFNCGNSRNLPYKGMSIFIAKKQMIPTEDKDMADALSAYPYIDVLTEIKDEDYDNIHFSKLKKIAREKGIELHPKIKKKELIKLIDKVR